MNERIVNVLDLGSTKVVCLSAQMSGTEVEILGVSAVPCSGIRKGVIVDLDQTAMSIDNATRKLAQETESEVGDVVVGIAGSHLEGVNAQGFVPIFPRTRPITREDVLQVINHSRQMVTPPDREQIQAIPREFKIDGQRNIQHPIGMNGAKLEVVTHIVTGSTTQIQNIERAVSMTGRKVEQMVVQPLASGLAVLTDEEIELGAVVVDIGGGTTDIAVFSKGAVAYTASIPVGGELVTSDIYHLLKTTPEEAERIKHQYGAAHRRHPNADGSVDVIQLGQSTPRPLQRKVLCEIIESRMRELATLVRQQIERSGMFGVLPVGVVLTGGGSNLPGTSELFAEVLRHMPARVSPGHATGKLRRVAELPAMSTALGLAKFALDDADDLVPASGGEGWREKIRSLRSLFSGKH